MPIAGWGTHVDSNELSKWVDALGQGDAETALRGLLKAYAEARSAELADLINLSSTNAPAISVEAMTQHGQMLEVGLGPLSKAVVLRSIRFERGFLAQAELAGPPPETSLLQLLRSVECTPAQLSPLATRGQTRWLRSMTLHSRAGIDAAAEVLSHVAFSTLNCLTLVSVIAHVNDVLPVLFRLESLRNVTTLRFQRGVIGAPSPDVLAKAPRGTEQIDLLDSQRKWTRGSIDWPDTRNPDESAP